MDQAILVDESFDTQCCEIVHRVRNKLTTRRNMTQLPCPPVFLYQSPPGTTKKSREAAHRVQRYEQDTRTSSNALQALAILKRTKQECDRLEEEYQVAKRYKTGIPNPLKYGSPSALQRSRQDEGLLEPCNIAAVKRKACRDANVRVSSPSNGFTTRELPHSPKSDGHR